MPRFHVVEGRKCGLKGASTTKVIYARHGSQGSKLLQSPQLATHSPDCAKAQRRAVKVNGNETNSKSKLRTELVKTRIFANKLKRNEELSAALCKSTRLNKLI